MIRTVRLLALSLAALSSAACSTIYFEKGSHSARNLEYGEWHHIGVARLVEFSPAVDMNQRCEGNPWESIKVEQSFVQGLVQGVTNNLYSPWDVSYSCKK